MAHLQLLPSFFSATIPDRFFLFCVWTIFGSVVPCLIYRWQRNNLFRCCFGKENQGTTGAHIAVKMLGCVYYSSLRLKRKNLQKDFIALISAVCRSFISIKRGWRTACHHVVRVCHGSLCMGRHRTPPTHTRQWLQLLSHSKVPSIKGWSGLLYFLSPFYFRVFLTLWPKWWLHSELTRKTVSKSSFLRLRSCWAFSSHWSNLKKKKIFLTPLC